MINFVKMSKYAGMREDLIQAGGGNSAYKITPDRMAIKASGIQLADVSEESGYAIVNPQIVKEAFLNVENIDSMTEEDSKKILLDAYVEGARPSIETFLHSILGKYSLHTHPVTVNALACRKNGREIILNIFPEALVVSYATPGIELAKAYFKEYKKYKEEKGIEPTLIFLMNHGFITSADTAGEVIEITERITRKIESYLRMDMEGYHVLTKINNLYQDGITWRVTDKNVLDAYSSIGDIWQHYFCPDCVVFLGKQMYRCPAEIDRENFNEFVRDNGYPSIIAYGDNLYIHSESVKKALETQSVLSFSAQVMLLNKQVQCNLLDEDEKNFLLNWDAEKYRRNMK